MHVLGKRICLCATVDKCRDLHHSFPGHQHLAPGSYRCHRPTVIPRTVPLLSQHPRCMEHCWRFRDLRVTAVHGELIRQNSLPRYPSWSVSSSFLVQQPSSLVSSPSGASCSLSSTHPSLGHNLAGCPIPPHTQHLRPFPLPLTFPPLLPSLCLHLSPLAFKAALPASFRCGHGWRLPATFCDVPCHWPPVEESWAH